ncbi:MAG: YggS family pyridoxal phosphate-dependent enzyme [Eubacteriaceae bacterium]
MISENIEKLKRDIPETVVLIAVTKYHSIEETQEVINSGVIDLGESKVQDFLKKYDALDSEVRWHFIGHLQRNKVKHLIGKTALIHSGDSFELIQVINKESEKKNVVTPILLQINLTQEPNKSGFTETELLEKLGDISKFKHILVLGIMGMGPHTKNNDKIKKNFMKLKIIYDRIRREFQSDNIQMKYLSMGMTDDYKIAIEEGSNMVRIGRKIFIS